MSKKHNKHRKKKDNRKLNNTLDNVIAGFKKIPSDELMSNPDYAFGKMCGYMRLPHENDKGYFQGYCALKEKGCLWKKSATNYETTCSTYRRFMDGEYQK